MVVSHKRCSKNTARGLLSSTFMLLKLQHTNHASLDWPHLTTHLVLTGTVSTGHARAQYRQGLLGHKLLYYCS